MRGRLVLCAAALLSSSGALAQAWVGTMIANEVGRQVQQQNEHLCLMGNSLEPDQFEEPRWSSEETMRAYWAAAQAGAARTPGSLKLLFDGKGKRGTWRSGDRIIAAPDLEQIVDPYVALAPGGAVVPVPKLYFRSGDMATTERYFFARNAAGAYVGAYHATFRYSKSAWRLSSLSLIATDQLPAAIQPYCHRPGDIEPYVASYQAAEAAKAAKKAAAARN